VVWLAVVDIERTFIPTHLSGRDTHQNPRYALLWARYAKRATQTLDYTSLALDPFSRNCTWAGDMTNDINPDTEAQNHQDALAWVQTIQPESVAIGLLDPPFSDRQGAEKYGTGAIYSIPGYLSHLERAMADCIVAGGYIIKCGYNTNRPSDTFSLVEIQLCCFGGNRHDMLISVWRKTQTTLRGWWA